MNPDHNMKYEGFVRRVFGGVARMGDPLRLANTDINNGASHKNDLSDLRLGVAYSLGRLLTRLETEWGHTGKDYDTINSLIRQVLDSSITYLQIHAALDTGITILDKYDIPTQ